MDIWELSYTDNTTKEAIFKDMAFSNKSEAISYLKTIADLSCIIHGIVKGEKSRYTTS